MYICYLGVIKGWVIKFKQTETSVRPIMSYHLYIRKLPSKLKQEQLISAEEWLEIVQEDDDFSYIVDDGNSVSVIFNTADVAESIEWNKGAIDADKPSDLLARKMILIANKLDARVVTDQGICYF